MNGRSGTLSPVSVAGSEWSGISKYESMPGTPGGMGTFPQFNPGPGPHRGLDTPPMSANGSNGPPPLNRQPTGGSGPPSRPPSARPSPPSSVARSSTATIPDERKLAMMEQGLRQHYGILQRYLAPSLNHERENPRVKKAKDKLLRLSAVQFHELSTDVYDELIRRQAASRESKGSHTPAQPSVPPALPPRDDFHPKRNHARQKLSTLPPPRFRDLATDVFYELERRFPKFSTDAARGPPGRPPNGRMSHGSARGVPPPGPGGRPPGPPGPGRGGYGPPGPGHRYPPRNGSLSSNHPSIPPSPGPGSMSGQGPPGPGLGINGVNNLNNPNGANGALAGSENRVSGTVANSSQGNTIVPNKSTMLEEDDSDEGAMDEEYDSEFLDGSVASNRNSRRDTSTTNKSYGLTSDRDRKLIVEYQSQVGILQEKVDNLESQLRTKDSELNRLHDSEQQQTTNAERQEWDSLRTDLETKLQDAVNLNNSLQEELDKVRHDQSNTEQDLRSQLDEAQRRGGGGGEWQTRYESLERDHHELQMELQKQQQVTEEVRQEASMFLEEMKALTSNTGQDFEKEEHLTKEVQRLEDEVKEWKGRYTKTRTQLRSLRATSIGLSISQPDIAIFTKTNAFSQPDGIIKDVHVTKFQISIDELLKISRTGEPAAVLDFMKTVVVAVKHITQDIDGAPTNGDELSQQRNKQKSKISATANNLITAAKNFASSNGISPVSLVDAAASHLTAAVVELIRTVKIKPTPSGELEDDDDDSIPTRESQGFFETRNRQSSRTSLGESVYSFASSPNKGGFAARPMSRSAQLTNGNGLAGQKMGYGLRPHDSELEDLKIYLEDQTDGLIQSIQALVGSVRGEEDAYTIQAHIEEISSVVGNVVSYTQHALDKVDVPGASERAGPVTDKLANCQSRLLDASEQVSSIQDMAKLREFTNKLPPLAFEIARETKELVQRIEHLDEPRDEDDFR
ncbi:MAG: component of the polarisome [Cirrosporium novae-zelandiae]|nr:MAG: component of the polarisome [Cirrosporium novae-zelandiae]